MKTNIICKANPILLVSILFFLLLFSECKEENGGSRNISQDTVESICARIAACQIESAGIDSEEGYSECVEGFYMVSSSKFFAEYVGSYDDVLNCLEKAGNDCNKIYECLNEGHSPETCDPKSFQDRCEGSVVVKCNEKEDGSGYVNYYDCRRFDSILKDAKCVSENGIADCIGMECEEGYTNCDGNVMEMCTIAGIMRMDCSLYGSVCTDYMGYKLCRGTGADCNTQEIKCEGSRAIACIAGKEGVIDCEKLFGEGFICDPNANLEEDDFPCIHSSAGECDEGDYKEHCEGNVIKYCMFGKVESIDCKEYGFTSCVDAQEEGELPYCK